MDDRVGCEEYVAAVDYKTTRSSVPGGHSESSEKQAWADHVVLQIPLYAIALHRRLAEMEEIKISRIEYRALKQCCPVHSLELYQVDRKSHEIRPNEEAQEKLDRALEAVADHVLKARGGQFPAQPAESCGCPPFCHAWDICRVKGGPRRTGWR